jgi:hypothetical protein
MAVIRPRYIDNETISTCYGGSSEIRTHGGPDLPSIGWRSFFQIQDQRQNSAYQKHDRDQQHCRLPGSQLLNVSGRRPLPHNLSAQVRLWVSREGFRRNKAWGWGCAEAFNGTTRGRPARRRCAARRELERRDPAIGERRYLLTSRRDEGTRFWLSLYAAAAVLRVDR